MDAYLHERALREPYLGPSRVRLASAWELRERDKPATAEEIAANVARFRREVPQQRALLAIEDPAGEADAVAPLTPLRARQVLVDPDVDQPAPRPYIVIPARPERRPDGRDLLDRLGVDPNRGRGVTRCPSHDDRSASLSWRLADDGRALLHCFAGCDFRAILAALP